MTGHPIRRWSVRLVIGLLLGTVGCEMSGRSKPPPEPAPPPRGEPISDEIVAGTVGAITLFADTADRPLRGFGLVIGLDGRGSSDCPTVIRDYLREFLTKQVGPNAGQPNRRSPGTLIDSLDTAAVQVVGLVPAGARRGARFDLLVEALPGTATRSLEGGLLLPTELRLFDQAASGPGLIAGGVLGKAGGPIYMHPDADATDPRRGVVLGGGQSDEDRPVRLMLLQPNYQLARAIERRINERFGQSPPIAEARSRGYVVLKTPPEYAEDPQHFQRVVGHLYLDRTPAYESRKRRALSRLASSGQHRLEPIALAWEALGRSILPQVQTFYTYPDPLLRFYASRTGLRLGDGSAVPVIEEIALDSGHEHQIAAVEALGTARSTTATLRLTRLLDRTDPAVRVAAYRALARHNHPVVHSRAFRHMLDRSQLNCILDTIDCDGPPLIYVRHAEAPRIALFGEHMSLVSPVFYAHPDNVVTIVTNEGSDDVRVYTKRNGRLSDEILIPPEVSELIAALAALPLLDEAGQLRGIGLPYSRVVDVLKKMEANGTIPGQIIFEEPEFGPLMDLTTPTDRPETDTDPIYEPGDETPEPADDAPALEESDW